MSIERLKPIFPLKEQNREGVIDRSSGFSGQNGKTARELALRQTSKEFESLFIYQMLKAMRKTIPEDGLFEGITGKDTYTTIMDQQLASALAERGGLGIAEIIYRQMMPIVKEGPRLENVFAPPLEGVVSSSFGMRIHPILGHPAHHPGVDIAAPEGTEIQAAADGQVLYSGWLPHYGNTVMIEHAEGYVSLYAHNKSNDVLASQRVEKGQIIARVGSTGRSTGPHLHFEIRLLGNPIDPKAIVVAGSDDSSKNA